MSDKELFKKHGIINIDKLFNYCQNEISYGWIDQEGKKHEGVNDAKTYSLQSPRQLIANQVGICWDMTELYRSFFLNMTNLKIETYYLFYDNHKGCPSHSILVFYKKDKVYWFEAMSSDPGIHEYTNIKDLLHDFKVKFIKNMVSENRIPSDFHKENIYLYQYNQPKYHINGHQMRDFINHSRLINLEKGE